MEDRNMPVISPQTISLLAPHVIELVKGVFRSRKDKDLQGASEQQAVDILNKDVVELQEMVLKHASAIGEIARGAEARFAELERQLQRQRLYSIAALAVALVAVAVALFK
jgi:hypothetical protein